ncbi:DUF4351 domain-containing protein [Rhodocyclaceae bacterium SMB388]
MRDAKLGRRHVDKLVRGHRHDRREDWMMRLPDELESRLWHHIENIEGERNVKYVTSVERLAIERGMEKGRKEGHEEGREKGREEGSRALLARLLASRFGPLPGPVTERLASATTEQLERWAERLLGADSLDDVFTEN